MVEKYTKVNYGNLWVFVDKYQVETWIGWYIWKIKNRRKKTFV